MVVCVGVCAAYLEKWQGMVEQTAADLLGHSASGGGESGGAGGAQGPGSLGPEVPVLDNPVIGQLTARK